MKNLPLIPKVLINIMLFGIYFVIGSVIVAVVYGLLGMVIGYSMPKPTDPVFDKLGWIAVVVTFVLTLIYRKYFYMPIVAEDEDKKHHKKKKSDFSLEE